MCSWPDCQMVTSYSANLPFGLRSAFVASRFSTHSFCRGRCALRPLPVTSWARPAPRRGLACQSCRTPSRRGSAGPPVNQNCVSWAIISKPVFSYFQWKFQWWDYSIISYQIKIKSQWRLIQHRLGDLGFKFIWKLKVVRTKIGWQFLLIFYCKWSCY